MMLRMLLAFGLAFLAAAAHAGDPATAAARFREAQRAVAAHKSSDGTEIDASPASVMALQAQWAAARDLVAALLDRDPGITPAGIARHAKQIDGLRLDALRLDPGALLVNAESGAFSTVFLLHRAADGTWRAALALDAPQGAPDRRMPELAAWLPGHAGSDCREPPSASRWSRCGPVSVERLIPLPAEKGGARRFAILAYQVTPAGGTIRYQISIWRWDGRIATPLLARTLFAVLGDSAFASQDARGFTLHAADFYKSLHACGECHGRQMIWRFDLPPTGAAAPRIRSLSPELDLVDRFYTRFFDHRPTGDLAAPGVVAQLQGVELDMLNSWRYLGQSRGARLLCVDAMGFDRPQIFRIVRRNGKPWIASVTFARAHTCDGSGLDSGQRNLS